MLLSIQNNEAIQSVTSAVLSAAEDEPEAGTTVALQEEDLEE